MIRVVSASNFDVCVTKTFYRLCRSREQVEWVNESGEQSFTKSKRERESTGKRKREYSDSERERENDCEELDRA